VKEQDKQNVNKTRNKQDELEFLKDLSKNEKNQPVPQPKDFEDIEY
jgi:hypothetical protein